MKLSSMVMVAVVQGMETPPNKKGKSTITLINTKLQHPLPPLRCRLCPGGGEFEPESFNMEVF